MTHKFVTTDTEHRNRNEQPCTIVRTITEPDNTHDTECLPMHIVKFPDGTELEVFTAEAIPAN